MPELLHKELTSKIINAAYQVHKELGCGFYEKVYQEALAIVLKEKNIDFEREKELQLQYHGQVLTCGFKPDFIVDNKIIVELKAVKENNPIYEAQTINYLRATGIEVGLLINFGQTKLSVKRYINIQQGDYKLCTDDKSEEEKQGDSQP